MKHLIRIVALILVLATLFSLAVGCKKKEAPAVSVEFSDEYTLTPLTASASQFYFMYNPDRGFRTHNIIKVDDLIEYVGDEQKLSGKIATEFNIFSRISKNPVHFLIVTYTLLLGILPRCPRRLLPQ